MIGRTNRTGLWRVLQLYGVQELLVEAIKSFYEKSKSCVKIVIVGKEDSELLSVKVGLRQVYLMLL